MNDNVIKFPTKAKEEELEFSLSEEDAVIEAIWVNVLESLRRTGHDFAKDPDKFFPSMVLIFESIRSLSLMEKGETHPLQTLADEFFGYENLKEELSDREDGRMTLDELFSSIEESKENVDN